MADSSLPGKLMAQEIASQPDAWEQARGLLGQDLPLPRNGERVAVVGCGTSFFIAQSYARLREDAGFGHTDAFAASEAQLGRGYDSMIAISRSGTTTEVLELIQECPPNIRTIGIFGDPDSPLVSMVNDPISLAFADEESVVQTRFATSVLALLRTSLGENLDSTISEARGVLAKELDAPLLAAEQFTFLGRGWAIGIAHEAALKLREAAQAWTESYPTMEYRHGPISIAKANRVSWSFGQLPEGMAKQILATGAHLEQSVIDPMASLVQAQLVALKLARLRGLNPDSPRNLTRSVILSSEEDSE